jgi:hypothetical protein
MNNDEDHRDGNQSLHEQADMHNIYTRLVQGCGNGDSFSLACVSVEDWAADVVEASLEKGKSVDKAIADKFRAKAEELVIDDICRNEDESYLPNIKKKGYWERKRFAAQAAIDHLDRNLPQ